MGINVRKRLGKNGRTTFFLDIYHNGVRTYEPLEEVLEPDMPAYLRKEIEHEVNAHAAARLDQLRRSGWRREDARGNVPFVDYYKSFLPVKATPWRSVVKWLETFPQSNTKLKDIDKGWVVSFRTHLVSGKLHKNTASGYLRKIVTCLNHAVKDEIIISNPAKLVEPIPLQKVERAYLTEEDVKKLIDTPAPNEESKKAFLFCILSGLRMGDTKALRWKNLVNEAGVWVAKIRIQKTQEPAEIPLPDEVVRLIGERKDPDAKVFELVSFRNVNKHLEKWAQSAALGKHISTHVGRHTCAHRHLENDTDIYTLSKLLGHTRVKTTEIYSHISRNRKSNAVKNLPKLF